MKRIMPVIYIMLLMTLTGCSKDVNEHIRQQYHIGGQDMESTSYEQDEKITAEYFEHEQSSQAEQNGNIVYDVLHDTNLKQYNSFFDMAADDDTPLAKRFVLVTYGVYAQIKYMAPYIGVASVAIGWIIFFLSKYNKGLRRFALYGLIMGIPLLLIFIIYGYGILADIFMY